MAESVQLKCKKCGGTLTVDADKEILACPFCGEKELIVFSDEVEIQRIKSNTEKELEIEKMDRADAKEREEKAEAKAEAKEKALEEKESNYKKSKFAKVTLGMAAVSIITAIIGFSDGAILAGIFAVIQFGLFLASWLMGARVIPEKKHNLHLLLAIIAFVLIIPVVIFIDKSGSSSYTEDKTVEYEWPTSGLATMLPQPTTKTGKIDYDYEDSFSIEIYNIPDDEYKEYVKACKERGFTVNASSTDSSYDAYDENEYDLSLSHNDGDLWIHLSAPTEVKELSWPTMGLATLIPTPSSLKGNISYDQTDMFRAKIVDFDKDMFNAYVDECIDLGFTEDHSRTDNRYSATDANGNELQISFNSDFNYINISIDGPDEDDTTKASKETTTKKSGEDVSYKEFWDSYEAFMDQYVEFMKSYDSSNPLALVEYGKLMKEYADFTKKVDARKDEEMSNEEAAYALEVESRVANKLLSIG